MPNSPKNINPELQNAYLNTTYRVLSPLNDLRIGALHAHFDEFLIDNNVYTWAFITAKNPYSKKVSDLENEQRTTELKSILTQKKLRFTDALGIGDDTTWPPEESVLILGISLEEAIKIGQHFEQNAFVYGELSQKARLIWCLDLA